MCTAPEVWSLLLKLDQCSKTLNVRRNIHVLTRPKDEMRQVPGRSKLRIIRISLGSRSVKRGLIELVERRILLHPRH